MQVNHFQYPQNSLQPGVFYQQVPTQQIPPMSPAINHQIIQYQQLVPSGSNQMNFQMNQNPFRNPTFPQNQNRMQMDSYQQKMFFRQQQYFTHQAGSQKRTR